jgi:hypothetical protein
MTKEDPEQRGPWLTILSVVSLVIGAGALGWMVYQMGLDTLRAGLARVGWAFAAMCAAYLVSMIASAATLRFCTGPQGGKVRFNVYVRAALAGHAINEATPLGKLGEVTKFTLLSEHMPQARAASALIIQNFVSFITACVMIATAPLFAWLWFDPTRGLSVLLITGAAVFGLLGAGAFLIFYFGVGRWPFKVLRVFRVPKRRLERWEKKWRKVADEWREAARDVSSMRLAFASNLAARMIAVVEPWLALYMLQVDHALAAAWLSSASYQVVNWLTSFVPMQAGTAEAGAYGLFSGLGLPTGAGVLLEILRKLRRVTFITLGIGVLGWSNFKGLKRDARARRKQRAAAAKA